MTTIKVRDIGNSLGVVLPKELIARLRVSKGDKLYVQETVDGIPWGQKSQPTLGTDKNRYFYHTVGQHFGRDRGPISGDTILAIVRTGTGDA